MEVEEWIKHYEVVRNWFLKPNGERRYKPTTEKQYIQYMELWCKLTDMTPGQLANCVDVDEVRGIIAEGLREKCHLSVRSVIYRLHPLNSFWKYNGRQVNETYGGITGPLYRDIKRSVKWKRV